MTAHGATQGGVPALEFTPENCPIVESARLIGDRWTVILLREVFLGVRRFSDIQHHTGIPRQVLSDRLEHLVGSGLLRRVPYQDDGQRAREEYRLTDAGFDLYPVLVALADWGNAYLAGRRGPAVVLTHRDCGGEVHAVLRCDEGHDVAASREVVVRPGPGAVRRAR